jgi:hypothetical protein
MERAIPKPTGYHGFPDLLNLGTTESYCGGGFGLLEARATPSGAQRT